MYFFGNVEAIKVRDALMYKFSEVDASIKKQALGLFFLYLYEKKVISPTSPSASAPQETASFPALMPPCSWNSSR